MILQLLKQHPFAAISLLGLFAVVKPYQSISNVSLHLARLPRYRHLFPAANQLPITVTQGSSNSTDCVKNNSTLDDARKIINGQVVLTFIDTFSVSLVKPSGIVQIPPKKPPPGGPSGQPPPLKPQLTEAVQVHLFNPSGIVEATPNGPPPQKPPPNGGHTPPLKPKLTKCGRADLAKPSGTIEAPLEQQLPQNPWNDDKPTLEPIKPKPRPKLAPNRCEIMAEPRHPKPIRPKPTSPKPRPSRFVDLYRGSRPKPNPSPKPKSKPKPSWHGNLDGPRHEDQVRKCILTNEITSGDCRHGLMEC